MPKASTRRDDHVLVADQDGIWKVPHRLGALRPGRVALAKDGSLLVADDTGGTIWRISYSGSQNPNGTTDPPR